MLACAIPVAAHEIGTTHVSALVEDGRYDIEVVTDAASLAEKLDSLARTSKRRRITRFDNRRSYTMIISLRSMTSSGSASPSGSTIRPFIRTSATRSRQPWTTPRPSWRRFDSVATHSSRRPPVHLELFVDVCFLRLDVPRIIGPTIRSPSGSRRTGELATTAHGAGGSGQPHRDGVALSGAWLHTHRAAWTRSHALRDRHLSFERPVADRVVAGERFHGGPLNHTRSLSIYGVITAPPAIVEPLIAVSIAYVAIENVVVRN